MEVGLFTALALATGGSMLFLKIALIIFHILLFAIVALLCGTLLVTLRERRKSVVAERVARQESELINGAVLSCQERIAEEIFDLTAKKDVEDFTARDVSRIKSSIKEHCQTLRAVCDRARLSQGGEAELCPTVRGRLYNGYFNAYFLLLWLERNSEDPKKFFAALKEFSAIQTREFNMPFYRRVAEIIKRNLEVGKHWQEGVERVIFYEKNETRKAVDYLQKEGARLIEIMREEARVFDMFFACCYAYLGAGLGKQNKSDYAGGRPGDFCLVDPDFEIWRIGEKWKQALAVVEKELRGLKEIIVEREVLGERRPMLGLYRDWRNAMCFCYDLTKSFLNKPLHSSDDRALVVRGAFSAMEDKIKQMRSGMAQNLSGSLLSEPIGRYIASQEGLPDAAMGRFSGRAGDLRIVPNAFAPGSCLCDASSLAASYDSVNKGGTGACLGG